MNNSQAARKGRIEVRHACRVISVPLPLLRQRSISLALTPGPFQRTLMSWIRNCAGGGALMFFEAPRRHCGALIDEFDTGAVGVTIGSAMVRLEATHLPGIRRALCQ